MVEILVSYVFFLVISLCFLSFFLYFFYLVASVFFFFSSWILLFSWPKACFLSFLKSFFYKFPTWDYDVCRFSMLTANFVHPGLDELLLNPCACIWGEDPPPPPLPGERRRQNQVDPLPQNSGTPHNPPAMLLCMYILSLKWLLFHNGCYIIFLVRAVVVVNCNSI